MVTEGTPQHRARAASVPSDPMDDALLAAAGTALGAGIVTVAGVSGGDVAAAYRAELRRRSAGVPQDPRRSPAGVLHDRGLRLALVARRRSRAGAGGAGRVRRSPVPRPRVDRRGPARSPGPSASSGGVWPSCTGPARRPSAARTGAPPAAGACRTSRARRGPSSTPRSGCCRSPAWPGTAGPCRTRRSPTSSASPAGSASSADRSNHRPGSTATCGPATVSSTGTGGAG